MNPLRITQKILVTGLMTGFMMSMSMLLSGCLTEEKKDSTSVTIDTNPVPLTAEFELSVGAQGNPTLGTAIDLDTKKVMLSDAALAAQGTIDLLFVFSGGELQIASPVAAKAAGDVPLATKYGSSAL